MLTQAVLLKIKETISFIIHSDFQNNQWYLDLNSSKAISVQKNFDDDKPYILSIRVEQPSDIIEVLKKNKVDLKDKLFFQLSEETLSFQYSNDSFGSIIKSGPEDLTKDKALDNKIKKQLSLTNNLYKKDEYKFDCLFIKTEEALINICSALNYEFINRGGNKNDIITLQPFPIKKETLLSLEEITEILPKVLNRNEKLIDIKTINAVKQDAIIFAINSIKNISNKEEVKKLIQKTIVTETKNKKTYLPMQILVSETKENKILTGYKIIINGEPLNDLLVLISEEKTKKPKKESQVNQQSFYPPKKEKILSDRSSNEKETTPLTFNKEENEKFESETNCCNCLLQ